MTAISLVFSLFFDAALAQDYAFPTSVDDYGEFYPTAYVDQGSVTDWDCQSLTYSGHEGSDFGGGGFTGMDAGRDITAAADGEVIAIHDGEFDRCTTSDCYGGGGFGNYVYLQHADGKVTIYGHLKQFSVLVGTGDQVVCGQKLGEMGSSGFSSGPHLHFQVENTSGNPEDPFDGPCSAPPSYWLSQGQHGLLPDNSCGPPLPCTPVGPVSCGEVVATANDGAGSTSATYSYGCTDYTYSGPEVSWTFSSPIETPVTLSVTGLSGDLDLFVVGSTECAGNDCIGASTSADLADEGVEFVAEAGVEYVIVVDGWEGATSPFTLGVDCAVVPTDTGTTGGTTDGSTDTGPGGTTDTDGGTTDAQTDAQTDDPGDDDDDLTGDGTELQDDLVSEPKVIPGEPAGCGCASTGSMGAGGLLVLGLLALRRRR